MTSSLPRQTPKARANRAARRPADAHRRAAGWAGVCASPCGFKNPAQGVLVGMQAATRPEAVLISDLFNFKV